MNLKHVLGDIQTDRGNLHLEGSPHVIRLRRSLYGTSMPGAGAVHHIRSSLPRPTSTISIVFAMGADPVALGLVASLNRPGGNVTGVTGANSEIMQKRMQLLHDLVPNAKRFGHLVNPSNGVAAIEPVRDAVRTWGGTLEVAYASAARDFDAAFADFAERHVEVIAVGVDLLFISEHERLARVAAQYAMPAVYGSADNARTGGLMSYGAATTGVLSRQAGLYAGRILKGERVALAA
jgi:putative tryptophan/tyrosine transport system substrate-binding protein